MVRYQICVSCLISLECLHAVVEEKVNQDSIDFCVRVLPSNLPPDEFNSPNATPYKFTNVIRKPILTVCGKNEVTINLEIEHESQGR